MKPRKLEWFALDALSSARKREMSPKQFLRYSQTHASKIKTSCFVPARLGSEGFGFFRVETR